MAVLIDDMCDTGETLSLATATLQAAGAKGVYAMVSHGLLSGDSIKTISKMPIEKLVVRTTLYRFVFPVQPS